ncbi:DEAD/DEAH box helicase [Conexibacter stalactiti]|uniref:DEAD/DEAH box helicase n=1 Tax=Conexibacter stalactiti TaxID=1940611 RepID=A0ABU4HKH3_9ACTN|nr:DEAD/DEAH box helicase [Conexibacter stalactiti]MDW5593807.1 DEAD/DEAH box helicase [Conexibacter stalactiti]MEC5034449.1 DEAD/DEAH box helicase [Conexibacter stalactiti]
MAATDEIVEPWEALLARGRADERLVHESVVPPRAGRAVPIPGELHHEVRDALKRVGIAALHTHQEQALYAAIDGPTIVTTGTASGKSLCFNLPTLQMLHVDPRARALYLYPTKALAQDQVRALAALRLPRLRPAIYDGDTPQTERRAIRRTANVVLTNPDMLHVGILPNHAAWGDFLANLAVVVVDEAHVYRGVFGSHVANVLRRLRRIAAAYGTEPRFLLASATVANPLELAQRLTGLEQITLVDEDGAPSAQRTIAMWNPPLLDETLGSRASALSEAADLFADLVAAGSRTICFIKSRKAVEVILRSASARLRQMDHPDLAEKIAPYRAGYTSFQRRELEQRLMSGELRGVVATDALELGIDIGELDAAICVTFPGTVASLRQMWGRAGRRGRGLAVYVAGEDALDQFFCRHPDEFLERPVEAAILDHESEQIHAAHLVCAAHEGPLSGADAEVLGPRWREHAERLVSAGVLIERRGRFQLRAPEEFPAARVPLRSSSTDAFVLIDVESGEMIGTMEAARAFNTVHDGAVYLHMGRAFEVAQLDLHERRALMRPFDGDWFTQPRRETMTAIERLIERRETMGVRLSFGTVIVTDLVVGYQRKSLVDHETIDFHALDLPETAFTTQALWYELDDAVLGPDAFSDRLLGALHAAEHSQIAVLPLLAMCDRWDIGGLSTNAHPQTGRPTIFIYDGHPGGVGITRQGFLRFEQLVGDAHRLISECRCKHGCPSCIQSPKCGNLNEPLSKGGASALMRRLLSEA